MNELVKKNLVDGVSVKHFHFNDVCVSCKKGKQKKKSHPHKKVNSVEVPFECLHMDVIGPMKCKSINNDQYILVVTDDYSRFSWVFCMPNKSDTFENLMILFSKIKTLYKSKVRRIRSDNGTEFKNHQMEDYCKKNGILHEFSSPYTP